MCLLYLTRQLNMEIQENTVFFDGICNLCNGAVDFIIKRDKQKAIKFCSLQSKLAVDFFKVKGKNASALESICFWQDNKLLKKSRAVLSIASHLGWTWKFLSIIAKPIPTFLADKIYDMVAKNRYRWFGKRDECRIPTEEERSRFIC